MIPLSNKFITFDNEMNKYLIYELSSELIHDK